MSDETPGYLPSQDNGEGKERPSRVKLESVTGSKEVAFRFGSLREAKLALGTIMDVITQGNEQIFRDILTASNKVKKFNWEYVGSTAVKTSAEIQPTSDESGFIVIINKAFSEGTNFRKIASEILQTSPIAQGITAHIRGESSELEGVLEKQGMKREIDAILEYKVREKFMLHLLEGLQFYSHKDLTEESGQYGKWEVIDFDTFPAVFRTIYDMLNNEEKEGLLRTFAEKATIIDPQTLGPLYLESSEVAALTKDIDSAVSMLKVLHYKGKLDQGIDGNSQFARIYNLTLSEFFKHLNNSTQKEVLKKLFSLVISKENNAEELPVSLGFGKDSSGFSSPTVYMHEAEMLLSPEGSEYSGVKANFSITRQATMNLTTFDVTLGEFEDFSVFTSLADKYSSIDQNQVIAGLSTLVGESTERIEEMLEQSQSTPFVSPAVQREWQVGHIRHLLEQMMNDEDDSAKNN